MVVGTGSRQTVLSQFMVHFISTYGAQQPPKCFISTKDAQPPNCSISTYGA